MCDYPVRTVSQHHSAQPLRLLIVLPSWVGDAVMATPSLRVIREALPGAFIGGLARPGIDEVLAGSPFFDEMHVDRAVGMMGPKRVAARIRHRRYDAALLLTNSFSTALISRLAGIPQRIGYDRDARGVLLTDALTPPRRRDTPPFNRGEGDPGGWAPVPACEYYFTLAQHFLKGLGRIAGGRAGRAAIERMGPLELAVLTEDELAADELLRRARVPTSVRDAPSFVVLNPGGNDEPKRWPADRFAALADYLSSHHRLIVLINGAPGEAELVARISAMCRPETRRVELPKYGVTLGTLKALISRSRLVVTNDTGPRHIAAALGRPVITLFGPTDHRWTSIPFLDEIRLLADPTLPEEEVANDHPERCRIDRIGLGDVVNAANTLLTSAAAR